MNTGWQVGSWQEAERLAAQWMRGNGFPDAQVTPGGADAGVDVAAAAAIAQVKFEAAQVGRPALQRLFGARGLAHGRQLLFFTGTGYSIAALEYADATAIGLFTYTLDGLVHPVNATARGLAASAPAGQSAARTRARRPPPAALPGRSPAKVARSRAGWWLALAGLCAFGLFNGLGNSENFDSSDDIVPALVVIPLLCLGVVVGLHRGLKGHRRRAAARRPGGR